MEMRYTVESIQFNDQRDAVKQSFRAQDWTFQMKPKDGKFNRPALLFQWSPMLVLNQQNSLSIRRPCWVKVWQVIFVFSKQACKPWSFTSLKLRPTAWLDGVKCRARSTTLDKMFNVQCSMFMHQTHISFIQAVGQIGLKLGRERYIFLPHIFIFFPFWPRSRIWYVTYSLLSSRKAITIQ